MTQRKLSLLGVLIAASVGALAPSVARAAIANGYVCSASFDPRAGTYGSYGSIRFSLTNLPDCAGGSPSSYVVLTTGADAAWTGFRYSPSQILVMFDQLQRAAAEGTRLSFGYSGGGSGYGALEITFSR